MAPLCYLYVLSFCDCVWTLQINGSFYKMADRPVDKTEKKQRTKYRVPYDHPDRYTVVCCVCTSTVNCKIFTVITVNMHYWNKNCLSVIVGCNLKYFSIDTKKYRF